MAHNTPTIKPKKYTLEQAADIASRCAKTYDRELNNRNLLFVYKSKGCICYYEVSFYSYNYMHLTGLKSANNLQQSGSTAVSNVTGTSQLVLTPNQFYRRCLNHTLKSTDIAFPGGPATLFTFLKLDVIESVINKNLSATAIGELSPYHKVLKVDTMVGNDTVCMGFDSDQISGEFVPRTLINGSYKKNIQNPSDIMITYRKNMSDPYYTEIVYVGKDANGNDINWDSINFTGKYAYLPKPV